MTEVVLLRSAREMFEGTCRDERGDWGCGEVKIWLVERFWA